MKKAPPFHQLHPKILGDRVKIPRHAADESRGFYYGTVIQGRIRFDREINFDSDGLIVEWDEHVPYLGKYSETFCAIAAEPSPVWNAVDSWRDAHQQDSRTLTT